MQELLARTGEVCSFWMDQIKTHCYVTVQSCSDLLLHFMLIEFLHLKSYLLLLGKGRVGGQLSLGWALFETLMLHQLAQVPLVDLS